MQDLATTRDDLKRIIVVGTSCSGKTTFARRLAKLLDIKHVELDSLHWLPGWKERPLKEFRQLVQTEAGADRWVIDGNYSIVRDLVWPRATAIVWLNYSFPIVAWRALSRTFRRIFDQQELFSGNRETFRQAFFTKDSILLWVLTTHRSRRREFSELLRQAEQGHLKQFVLRSPRQADPLFAQLSTKLNSPNRPTESLAS